MPLPWWWTVFGAPLLTASLAAAGAWLAISFDRRKTINQELIRKRISIYDQMAPKLNDLFCFFRSVGPWKSLNPALMISHKRELDRMIHVYGPLFSQPLSDRYHAFIHTMFAMYQGIGEPAKLRAPRARLQMEWGSDWKSEWDSAFVERAEPASDSALISAYDLLMQQFAAEIGSSRRPRK